MWVCNSLTLSTASKFPLHGSSLLQRSAQSRITNSRALCVLRAILAYHQGRRSPGHAAPSTFNYSPQSIAQGESSLSHSTRLYFAQSDARSPYPRIVRTRARRFGHPPLPTRKRSRHIITRAVPCVGIPNDDPCIPTLHRRPRATISASLHAIVLRSMRSPHPPNNLISDAQQRSQVLVPRPSVAPAHPTPR